MSTEHLFQPFQDNIVLHQIHFVASYLNNSQESTKKQIKNALKKFGRRSAILSLIYMSKNNCITKEKYDAMYENIEDNFERKDLSVGEDLEALIRRIKNHKMNKDSIPFDGDFKESFLLCLLDKEERQKLEQKNEAFLQTFNLHDIGKADVREKDWKLSESNSKFSRSNCRRLTFFIEATSRHSILDP